MSFQIVLVGEMKSLTRFHSFRDGQRLAWGRRPQTGFSQHIQRHHGETHPDKKQPQHMSHNNVHAMSWRPSRLIGPSRNNRDKPLGRRGGGARRRLELAHLLSQPSQLPFMFIDFFPQLDADTIHDSFELTQGRRQLV